MVFRHEICAADESNSYCWAPSHSRYQPKGAKTQPINYCWENTKSLCTNNLLKISTWFHIALSSNQRPTSSSKLYASQKLSCGEKRLTAIHIVTTHICFCKLSLLTTTELNWTESYCTNNMQVTYTQHHECPWPQHHRPAHDQHMDIKNTWKIN